MLAEKYRLQTILSLDTPAEHPKPQKSMAFAVIEHLLSPVF